ncbi:hypothetical protein BDW59DRAFT_119420 [Aspergillus cavernicola]|uniref:Uncharacterized protein n=1 Tax=Aspergillus cavernicola TaxID=176166 RepID=A0ABR4HX35_9EURO
MASARLRKAFRYPDDSGEDAAREELDEEEQERVIRHLQLQSEKRDSQYSTVFAAIPLLLTMVFLPSLLSPAALGFFTRFFNLLSITSLLATAYTMKYVPPQRPDPKGKRPMRNPDLMMHVRRFIIPGNSMACVLLGLGYLFSSEAVAGIQPTAYLVPAALLVAILTVRQVMVSVDLKPLEDLRYEFKGA